MKEMSVNELGDWVKDQRKGSRSIEAQLGGWHAAATMCRSVLRAHGLPQEQIDGMQGLSV